MSLEQAIANYKQLKNQLDIDKNKQEYRYITAIPEARKNIDDKEQLLILARRKHQQAETPEDIKLFREEIELADKSYKDAVQLHQNISDKHKTTLSQWPGRCDEVARAQKNIWNIRREQLIASFNLPPDVRDHLEQLIIATDGTDPGFKSRKYGDYLNELVAPIDTKELKDKREAAFQELIA